MILAIFDLDDTLTLKDTESLWQEYLAEKGLISPTIQKEKKKEFQEAYEQGRLNFHDVIAYSIAPIGHLSFSEQQALRNDFLNNRLHTIVLPNAQSLVQSHVEQGHYVIILSAGHDFLIDLSASFFPAHTILSTKLQRASDGQYLAQIEGEPLYREQKVYALQRWLASSQYKPTTTYFYSDSINDLPLLEWVDIPMVVNPCSRLKNVAVSRSWPILDLKKEFLALQHNERAKTSA